MAISPHAIVHPDADIHPSVVIDAFAIVEADVVLGADTHVHSHAMVRSGTHVGARCEIHPGAIIGGDPQDLKYDGSPTTLTIGSDTVIREYATINRGTQATGTTSIGSYALIMAYAHVAHDCQIGDHAVIANAVNLAGHVSIDDHAIIGGMSAVQQFVHIGESVYIGGGAMIRKNIPPFIKVAREPLSYLGINAVGLQRRGWNEERIDTIEQAYYYLMVKHRNVKQGIEALPEELSTQEDVQRILQFIDESKNGIVKGYRADEY